MKNRGKLIGLIVILAVIPQLLICSHYQNDNPFDVLYPDANYTLKARWESLHDTLYIDTPYILPCTTSIKLDTFSFLTVSGRDSAVVSARMRFFDTVELTFKQENPLFIIHLEGVRPNAKIVSDSSGKRIVVNQFRPVVTAPRLQKVVKGADSIPVMIYNRTDSAVTVYWRLSASAPTDSLIDTIHQGIDTLIVNTLKSGSTDTAFIWARNSLGFNSPVSSCVLSISGAIPVLHGMSLPDTIACGDTIRLTVNLDGAASLFRAIISSDYGHYTDTSNYYPYAHSVMVTMHHPIIDTGLVVLHVQLVDTSGLTMPSSVKDSLYVRYSLPALFLQKQLQIPIGSLQPISVVDSNAAATIFLWRFSSENGGWDTTNTPVIKKIYKIPTVDSVSVFGINRFGYRGASVSAVVLAQKMKYFLSQTDSMFPVIVTARRAVNFGVTLDSVASFTANNGVFFWAIDSAGKVIFDTNCSQCSSIVHTFIYDGIYTVSVIARDSSGNASNTVIKPI